MTSLLGHLIRLAKWLATIAFPLLVAAAQTSPVDATSNIAGWLKYIRFDALAAALSAKAIDRYALVLGLLGLLSLLATAAWGWWRGKHPRFSSNDGQSRDWVSLADAVRHLVEESAWGQSLGDEDDDYVRSAMVELKDNLAFDLVARGRRGPRAGGAWGQALETIPTDFWPAATFDVHRMLLHEGAQSTATTDKGDEWTDIRLPGQEVRARWPAATGAPTNRYILAARAFREFEG